MVQLSDNEFEKIVGEAIDAIPEKYYKKIENVVFTVEDVPTEEQRQRFHLLNGQTLYGLYEGIPLTRRGANYNLVIPDRIIIFKRPIELSSHNIEHLREQVRHTVWHEVAHYFGLSHDQIYKLDGTDPQNES